MNDSIRKNVINTILEAIPDNSFTASTLPETARFFELGISSINMLSIMIKLEEGLSVNLLDLGDQIEPPATVQDLFQLVDKLVQHATPKSI